VILPILLSGGSKFCFNFTPLTTRGGVCNIWFRTPNSCDHNLAARLLVLLIMKEIEESWNDTRTNTGILRVCKHSEPDFAMSFQAEFMVCNAAANRSIGFEILSNLDNHGFK
jgi:hypothetical protein